MTALNRKARRQLAARPAPSAPPPADLMQALALRAAGRFDEAEQVLAGLVAAEPGHFQALYWLGLQLAQSGRPEAALAALDRALAIAPLFVEALNVRGAALTALGRYEDAVATLDAAIALRPEVAEPHVNRANALFALHRPEAALAGFDDALARFNSALGHSPDIAAVYRSRAVVLAHLSRHAEAVAAFDRALALRPAFFEAHFGRAESLRALRRFAESLAASEAALGLHPTQAAAINQRGVALQALGRIDEARAAFDAAIAADLQFIDPRFNRGLVALIDGDYRPGFQAYEWRYAISTNPEKPLLPDAPHWRGEPLAGRSIFVRDEQGLGDTIQFCRFVLDIERQGADVTLCVAPKMAALLRSLGARARIVAEIPPGERFDFQCPLLSLPHGLGLELSGLPGAIPYLAAEPDRVGHWRERIGEDGFKVGIVWAGSELAGILGRNVTPQPFLAFARAGVRLISLQHGAEPPPGIESLGPGFNAGPDAFLDSAAAMMAVDLVVSVDTSAAHLAGALGRPVWVALPFPCDWRWLLGRADSPWYPTMRVFRSRAAGRWDEVFAEMAAALRGVAGGGG